MLRTQFLGAAVLVIFGIFLSTGCYYDAVLPAAEPTVDKQVSFANDILPIFNKSCNTSGCHITGGTKPDLTAANAYNSLKNGNYLNTATPASSELYLWMKGQKALPMPLSGPNAEYNALVLAWIQQGALNN